MSDKPFQFESALKELEEITQWFESGDADLDQGLVKFERGMELASKLKEHLGTIENRVEKIKQRFAGPAGGDAAKPAASAAPNSAPGDDQPPLGEPPEGEDQAGLFE